MICVNCEKKIDTNAINNITNLCNIVNILEFINDDKLIFNKYPCIIIRFNEEKYKSRSLICSRKCHIEYRDFYIKNNISQHIICDICSKWSNYYAKVISINNILLYTMETLNNLYYPLIITDIEYDDVQKVSVCSSECLNVLICRCVDMHLLNSK